MAATKDYQLKLKALDSDTGAFTGIASPYGDPPDLMGDVIEKNSFAQSIRQQGNGYPLLWAHSTSEPLGLAKVSDSSTGLIVNGSLLLDDPAAKRAHLHLKAGSIKGISIGYSLPHDSGKIAYRDDGARILKEIRLDEISLVACPAAPRAQVTSVKSLDQVQSVLRGLTPGRVNPDELTHLRGIGAELKRLLKRDDDDDEDECECDCPQCLAGDCEDCSDPECIDENCEANIKHARENTAALKGFAAELKRFTGT